MRENATDVTTGRAVVYMRVNEDAASGPEAAAVQYERQRARCEAVARDHGLAVVAEYSDRTGAVRLDWRPGLRQLLDELPAKQVRYVITGGLERVSRSARDLIAIQRRLMEAGAELLVWGESPIHAHLRQRMAAVFEEHEAGRRERGARAEGVA